MPSDLKQLLHVAAARPSVDPDIERALRRGRHSEWIRRGGIVAAVVAVGLFAWTGMQVLGQRSDSPRIAQFNGGEIVVGGESKEDSEIVASGEHAGRGWQLEAFSSDGSTCLEFAFSSWSDSQRMCIPPAAAPKTAIGPGSISFPDDGSPAFIWGVLSPEVVRVTASFGHEEMELDVYRISDSMPVTVRVFVGFPRSLGPPAQLSAFDDENDLLETKQLPIEEQDE